MSYLIHFNGNHSSKDGRFISGDGDGDGQLNDNANRGKKRFSLGNGSPNENIGTGAALLGLSGLSAAVSAFTYKKGEKFVSGWYAANTLSSLTSGSILLAKGIIDKNKQRSVSVKNAGR